METRNESADTTIQHESGESKGKFNMVKNGKTIAYLTYSKAGEEDIILSYVEVTPELRGGTIGRRMVDHAVDYARKQNLKVIPLCPYIREVIHRDESLQDVLKQ